MTHGARSGFPPEGVADDTPAKISEWRAPYAINVHRTLSVHRRGGDPTYRVQPDGSVWRAVRTPIGPGTLRLRADPSSGVVHAAAWGPGAEWLLDSVPSMLGADDDVDGFAPVEPVLLEAWRRTGGSWRIGRTGLVLEALVPAILEQKVTGHEAHRAWRTLLRWYGTPAPGPAPAGMRVAPDAETWRHIPSWDWHRAGVGPQRAETVVRVARVASRMEEVYGLPRDERVARLTAVRGVGGWTAAETLQRAVGDPDADLGGRLPHPAAGDLQPDRAGVGLRRGDAGAARGVRGPSLSGHPAARAGGCRRSAVRAAAGPAGLSGDVRGTG